MKYYQVGVSSEPEIIGVQNGIYQVKIDIKAMRENPEYEFFFNFFSSKNVDFWKNQQKVHDFNLPIVSGRLVKNAKRTDVMGYTPSVDFLHNIYSLKFIRIISSFNLGLYSTFELDIEDSDEKYFFLFLSTIQSEEIDYEKSLVITGHKVLNNVKYHNIKNREEYKQFKLNNPLGGFEKIAIDKKYSALDIIAIQPTVAPFYSERLIDFLLDCGITGLEVGYNNSIQLDFV